MLCLLPFARAFKLKSKIELNISSEHRRANVPTRINAPAHFDSAKEISNFLTKIEKILTKFTNHITFLSFSFRFCFTLSSEFFASFDHSTCALSVSWKYLALGGVYLRIRATIPNSLTHWREQLCWLPGAFHYGALTLYSVTFQST